jgi:hypothetical protein
MLVVDLLVVFMGLSWDFARPSLFSVGLFQDGEDHAESVGWVRVVAQVNNETAIGVEPLSRLAAWLMISDLVVVMALREFGIFSDPDLGDEQVLRLHILPARDIKNGQSPAFCAAARRLV